MDTNDTRKALGQALEDFVNFRRERYESVSEQPDMPIEEVDRKATEIALKRIDRRVRVLDMSLFERSEKRHV